jgi:hypothetical protein
MRETSDAEARSQHAVVTLHQQMSNGEFRFRLKKGDGTAYIRTESSGIGAWQKSHYHIHVRETYIVQTGWIAYAVRVGDQPRIKIFHEGKLFTTEPQIIRNVYMSAHSVIHTVKHGYSDGEDRICDWRTEEFDQELQKLTEEERLVEFDKTDPAYDVAYRHYDDLIWRVPLWATGIVSVTMLGLNSATQKFISDMVIVPAGYVASSYLLVMFAATLVFSYVLHRFRIRQRRVRPQNQKRTPFWKSASTLMNLIVCVEAFFLLYLALLMSGWTLSWSLPACAILAVALAGIYERQIRKGA